MNINDYSMRLRELSDDYANQRLLPEEYRMQRKILLDQIDSQMNGIDSNYTAESSAVPLAVSAEVFSIGPEQNLDEEMSIIENVNVSAEVDVSGQRFAEETEKPRPANNLHEMSRRLNNVLGRLGGSNDDKEN